MFKMDLQTFAASKAIAGMNARIYVKASGGTMAYLGQMKDVSIDITQKDIDVTSLDSDGWEEYISGTKAWSVDTNGFFVDTDAGQVALDDAMIAANSIDVEFYPKDGDAAKGYKGTAVITKWNIKGATADAVQLSVTLRGNGPLEKYVKPAV